MGWTKQQFVAQAYEEIGYASYIYDLSPEQLQSALRRLDAMMAQWNVLGVRIGYPLPGSPASSNLADETGVPDAANEAIYTNLAIRLAGSIGKQVSRELKQIAKAAYDALLIKVAAPIEMQLPANLPIGAGAKHYQNPFVNPPTDPLLAGPDSELEFF